MPALSSTMKEGRVVEWLKSEGDTIESGEAIATIESDKADMDLEAFEDGVLAKILVGDGEVAQVGSPIALVADSSAEVDSIIAAGVGGSPPATAVTEDVAAPTAPASSSGAAAPDCDFEAVYMPALSSTMTEGKVVSWEIALGDSISAGEPMLTVESDKADMEVEVRVWSWRSGGVADEYGYISTTQYT
jgi:pyruvate dehydrogenase E2 component (dihydrolipoamide acetyltransferase)